MALQDIFVHIGTGLGAPLLLNSSASIERRTRYYPAIEYGQQARVILRLYNMVTELWWTKTEIDAISTWNFGIDDDFFRGASGSTPWVLHENEATTYEYDTDPSKGEVRVDADAFTAAFLAGIGNAEGADSSKDVYWAWDGLDGTDRVLKVRVNGYAYNAVLDPGDNPPSPSSSYVLASNNPPIYATDPSGGDLREGLFWFNSTDKVFRYYADSTVYNSNMTAKP